MRYLFIFLLFLSLKSFGQDWTFVSRGDSLFAKKNNDSVYHGLFTFYDFILGLKGGTTGQSLRKNSNNSYDFTWTTPTGSNTVAMVGTLTTGTWNATPISDAYISSSAAWSAKQSALVSGTNIKTINGSTLLGSGDLVVSANSAWGSISGLIASQTDLQTALGLKANLLSPIFSNASFTGTFSAPNGTITNAMLANAAVSNLSGTNTGDNATNTQYSGLAASKQNTVTTGTTAQYLKGDLSLGTYSGYTLPVQALTSSPTDAQTIYFGNLPRAPATVAATSKIYIRQSGTIKRAEIYCYSGTAGTAEAWVMSIRLNNTTDTQIASVSAATSERVFSNTALNIAVVSGDYIEIKSVNPTWATNPLTSIMAGYIYIE